MKFSDLLLMSGSSLLRRKLRTMLTVLGVLIGTASIVVMVSLGIGLNQTTLDQIESYGGLTTINVYSPDGGYYGVAEEGMAGGQDDEPVRITDETVSLFQQIEGVQIASPVLSVNVLARQGAYETNLYLQGMSRDALEKLNIPLVEGRLPDPAGQELELVFGNMVILDFYNAKTNAYYWDTGEIPPVDLIGQPLFVIFDTEAYWAAQNGGVDESGAVVQPPKKYMINGVGITEGGADDYNQHSYRTYCDVEVLKSQLKKIFKGKAIPGQPTTAKGKPYKEIYYNEAYIQVEKMEQVPQIQNQIREMGYMAESNAEWLEQMQAQANSIQAVLGGIGAVSLFVAAIGIANTMMMSIYERTKEIGIIKVLGCDIRNIRTMFLLEAGYIGFLGGILGIFLSYGISAAINSVMQGMEEYGYGISQIPLWLAAGSVLFAVLVGMAAGFFPALRAMRLSPLAAIRNE